MTIRIVAAVTTLVAVSIMASIGRSQDVQGEPVRMAPNWKTSSIRVEALSGEKVIILADGDFYLFDAIGVEMLRLKRSQRGDKVHEALATMIARIVSNRYDISDWRMLGESKIETSGVGAQ